MSNLIKVNADNFASEVLNSQEPVLVDFYADWCGPCRAVAPVVEELSEELAGRLKIAKLDVDQNEELSIQYGVQSIPTLILFSNGEESERVIGFLPKPQLRSKLEPHLTASANA